MHDELIAQEIASLLEKAQEWIVMEETAFRSN